MLNDYSNLEPYQNSILRKVMAESKTKVYRFDNEGNISRVKISEGTEVRV